MAQVVPPMTAEDLPQVPQDTRPRSRFSRLLSTASNLATTHHRHSRPHTPQLTSDTLQEKISSESSLTPETEDPWVRKSVLTLDGGGVRGYSSLLILQAIMKRIEELEQQEEPQAMTSVSPLEPRQKTSSNPPQASPAIRRKTSILSGGRKVSPTNPPPFITEVKTSSDYRPCHYFDYIGGTSTGGLIAIMLGRLGMTVDECLESYENLAHRVFSSPRRFHMRQPPLFIPREKFRHQPLEECIKEVVQKYDYSELPGATFPQANEDMSRTIVISWRFAKLKGTRVPYLFRSYYQRTIASDTQQRNTGYLDNYPIWKVGRATSAAPMYFKAVKMEENNPRFKFVDGGFGANNPTEEVYHSIKQMSNNDPKAVKTLVSIGTGKNNEEEIPGSGYALLLWVINTAAKWATDSEVIHERVNAEALRDGFDLFRLNVEEGIGKMKLDAWKGKKGAKTIQSLRTATNDYLGTDAAKALIERSARQLVDTRRARAYSTDPDHTDRWERFCHGVEYTCSETNCNDAGRRYNRSDLKNHLVNYHHHTNAGAIAGLLNRGRKYPLFEQRRE